MFSAIRAVSAEMTDTAFFLCLSDLFDARDGIEEKLLHRPLHVRVVIGQEPHAPISGTRTFPPSETDMSSMPLPSGFS